MLYPRLSADLLCIKSEGGIAARAGAGAILLQGEDANFVVETLFPLLDGTRTELEIVAELPSLAPDDVRNLLQILQDHGLLSCGPQSGLARPSAVQRHALLQAAKVLLVGATHRTASAAAAFRDAGIGTIKSDLRDFDGIDIAVGIFDER